MRFRTIIMSALVFTIALGSAMLPHSFTSPFITAQAFEAPENIEVKIGTVTIDQKDITEDTVVEVPVYMYNNPGFMAFNGVYKLDENLDFEKDHLTISNPQVSGVSIYRCRCEDEVVAMDIMSLGSHLLIGDGELIKLRIKLHENIPAGMYTISWVETDDGRMNILVEDYFEAAFGIEAFSKLENGGIIVTDTSEPELLMGDVNSDGKIDVEDAVMVIGHVNGNKALNDDEAKLADVDKNSTVDIEDAVAMIAHVNGIKVIE